VRPAALFGLGVLLVFAAMSSEAAASSPPRPAGGDDPPEGLAPSELAIWRGLEPSTRAWLRQVLARARAAGLRPVLVSGRRSCAEQTRLYAQGRTSPGQVVTHAKGCRSWHVHGRAVDVAFPKGAPASSYAQLGAIAKELGGRWGGDFQGFADLPHLEYHPGLTIEQACPDPDNCKDLPP
jgi:hypothetical protein